MSYNGSGTFNINTAGQPVVTGTVISSSVFNALTADLATGLSTAITKDGQTTITNNIPFNGYKITNLGAGTASTDAVRLGQLQAGTATAITVTGTDTYAGTMSPALASYTAGNTFSFVVPNTNTTGCTLNIDGQGAKAITRDGSTALIAGDLVAGSEVVVIYDGTRFQVLNSNSKTNWTVSNALTLSAGTSNQVQYLNGSKVMTGSANLTFDGTTLTANALTLSGGTANGVAYLNGSKALTTGSALTFDGTNFTLNTGYMSFGNNGYIRADSANNKFTFQAGTNGYLWKDSSNSGDWMALTSTGLGIGTSSPAQKLDVVGNATVSGGITSSGGDITVGTAGKFLYSNYVSQNSGSSLYLRASTASGQIEFQTNTTTKAILDSSGNLGLGVTPSAWANFKIIQVQGGGNFGSYTASGLSTQVGVNCFYDGSWKYVANGYASRYVQQDSVHQWQITGSGTAGNAISFTQAMTLDASGQLQIGTTSNTGGGRLEVVSNAVSAITTRSSSSGANQTVIAIRAVDSGATDFANAQYNALSHAWRLSSATAAMTLDASGNLGIGTTSPSYLLDLNTSSANQLRITSNSGSGVRMAFNSTSTNGRNWQIGSNFTTGNGEFAFYDATAGAERARIDSSGNLLVGTTSNPWGARFAVVGSSQGAEISTSSTTDVGLEIGVGSNGTGQNGLTVYSSAAGTTTMAVRSNGNIVNTNNSYGGISDIKVKENIVDATPKLADLMQVKVRNYNLKSDPGHKQIGVVAQEIEQVFPGIVEETPDRDEEGNDLGTTTKSVKYSVFVPMLIKAIQEQQAIIEQLKADVAALKGA